ncbi:MAG TPA: diacylglyceryl transferase, partial [Bacteroidetes bacterium]|nr:diacylglyceryl transferase [Bacteroidota bacterium]
DVMAPVLIAGYGVGRIGCQVAGDGDWGIENTAPKPALLSFLPDWMWSYTYPHNVNSEGIPIADCVGKHCNQLAIPVFPTPFYETVMCLFIFALLWFLRKRISIPGLLFSIYLILNGMERFLIEQIRVNDRYHFLGLSPTQAEIIALLLVITGIAGCIWTIKRSRKINPGVG